MIDAAIVTQPEPGASKQGCAGGVAEDHDHLPLHEDDVFLSANGSYLHL